MPYRSRVIIDKKLLLILGILILLNILMFVLGPPDSLDVKLYYTGKQARTLLESFDASELSAYFANEIFDLIFLSGYTWALAIVLQRVFHFKSWTLFLPLTVGIFDLIETFVILAVLNSLAPAKLLDWLGIFTFLKWSVGSVAVICVVGGLIQLKLDTMDTKMTFP